MRYIAYIFWCLATAIIFCTIIGIVFFMMKRKNEDDTCNPAYSHWEMWNTTGERVLLSRPWDASLRKLEREQKVAERKQVLAIELAEYANQGRDKYNIK